MKLGEKKNIEEVLKSAITPELEVLRTKLINTKQEKEKLLKTSRMPGMSQTAGTMTAERRVILPRDANIRRVHGSKI